MPLKIKDSCIVTGSKLIENDYYTEYFENKRKDINHFLKDIVGRETRYICDPNFENTLTMGSKAADDVFKKKWVKR
ncbi:3-oxoacyl-[acyl-carrier-protein] synthase-3 [Clostridium sp. DSM 8431]|uniref:hypothetical protein n=1 Tax=Clostridium sp. DSM 8431 TaxID=1761781 RepID=UPI0008E1FDA2|nr:hypothetical protein [Clostridium sp. DSM 8431]SFU79544.1 3-oxoacyl-[acyl-carrier-protein] synthase-3 [Clostridium sp. DSM 8431]